MRLVYTITLTCLLFSSIGSTASKSINSKSSTSLSANSSAKSNSNSLSTLALDNTSSTRLERISNTRTENTSSTRIENNSNTRIENIKAWEDFKTNLLKQKSADEKQGYSYVISGSLAVIGGFLGDTMTQDPLEKGVYAIFQSIGIAAIGMGFYQWKLGNEDRNIYATLSEAQFMTLEQKGEFIRLRQLQLEKNKIIDDRIHMLTHSMIALVNIYNASKQTNSSVKNVLGFIAGVNILAAISYSF